LLNAGINALVSLEISFGWSLKERAVDKLIYPMFCIMRVNNAVQDEIIRRIDAIDEGAFQPMLEQPVMQALLIMYGASRLTGVSINCLSF
jgi:hypothetical protein